MTACDAVRGVAQHQKRPRLFIRTLDMPPRGRPKASPTIDKFDVVGGSFSNPTLLAIYPKQDESHSRNEQQTAPIKSINDIDNYSLHREQVRCTSTLLLLLLAPPFLDGKSGGSYEGRRPKSSGFPPLGGSANGLRCISTILPRNRY